MKRKRVLHCWKGENDENEIGSDAWIEVSLHGEGTCMLLLGHDGPHVFTPNDEIMIIFGENENERANHTDT